MIVMQSMQPVSQQQQQPPPPPPHFGHALYHASSQQRASPDESSMPQGALPPIHHFESQTGMPQHFAPAPAPTTPVQHPPPYAPGTQYAPYSNGGLQPAPVNGGAGAGLMRYAAIPPQASLDARQMSGGRHKEIKRRTKTGCMTCRKRRIKCDEGQPTCRNCAKSKRECLGYEALFKQQSAGPAAIAAKPDPTPVQAPATPTSLSTNLYINPHSYPTTGGAFVEYGASLDPALGMGDHSLDMTQNHHSSLLAERRVKHVNMDDLFSINDIPPKYEKREAPPPLSQRAAQEVQDLYTFHFAPGLNKVFETDWFTSQGPSTMSTMPELHDFVAQCTEQLKVQADSPAVTSQLRSLEARLVWLLADMARQSLPDSELSARVDTLEHLLTSQPLTPSAIPSPPNSNMEQRTYSEHSFWHNLGRFVSAHDGLTDPAGQRETTEALAGMRGILGLLENRDVLYSIAVARHLGGRPAETNHSQHLLASTNDQNDDIHKLRVARQFVETEDQAGTTQVIQRICSMAIRGWALQKQ